MEAKVVYVLFLFSFSVGNHDTYKLLAASDEDRDMWVQCIRATLQHGSVYDTLTQRRKKVTGIQGLDIPELN